MGRRLTAPGERLQHRYELRERLGEGGGGTVWLAFDDLLNRLVALKELVPLREGIEDLAGFRERAVTEARMMAKLEHPAIVSIHDLLTVSGNPWIVMGYFHGQPLEHIIREQPPMSDREVARLGAPVLSGLMFAHQAGVVHRDVKPLNILVGSDNSVCLVDFGIAKPVGVATTTNLVMGTLEYMPPERLEGDSGEEPSDIWALGVVFYYAMEKRTPFNRVTVPATYTAIVRDDPPPLTRSGPLAEIVMRMLDKNPALRPKGEDVADVLRQALHTRSQRPPRQPPSEPPGNQATIPNAANASGRGHRIAGSDLAHVPGLSRFDHMPANDAATIITRESPEDAAALLLEPTTASAAKILDLCSHGYAGDLISRIAATHPQRAGRIMENIDPERAGEILSRMKRHPAARVLAAMLPADAAARLREADPLHAAYALADMAPDAAGRIIEVMEDKLAIRVLSRVAPQRCATIVKALPGGRGTHLASQFTSESFRRLVQEHM